jgi:hypothetical protein
VELLFRPFTRTWNWIELHWGFPGQLLFCLLVVFFILGIFYFVGNRRG